MTKSPLILLIDDDEVDRKMVVRAFRDYDPNIEIVQANDGQTGINLIGEREFDCVLLDYHLPDLDGLKILEWLMLYHL